MAALQSDRNLLFGILAWQMDFVDRDSLLNAMQSWVGEKQRSLGEILQSRGHLNEKDVAVIDALIERHLEKCQAEKGPSHPPLRSIDRLLPALQAIADPELGSSLDRLAKVVPEGKPLDPELTVAWPESAADSAGRFEPIRFHARGGLGEVFVAHDREVNRQVALKQIQDHLADRPDSRARFLLEAEVTGGLEHRGIPPVYGVGTFSNGRPFYAMRFVAGASLKEAIDAFHSKGANENGERSLGLNRLLGRFVDLCETIAYAHSRGVWHRDIKPSNIMLDKYGETIVLDWGLAKAAGHKVPEPASDELTLRPLAADGSPQTVEGSLLGTPGYMSPEQAAGQTERVGPASDIYSLGATLYCLLTGKGPFEGKSQRDILLATQAGDFARPRQKDPRISPALEAICLKAMKLHPEERYASVRALAEDVERWLADLPVTAYPEPFHDRTLRWLRRHKPWVISATALLLLGTAGLALHNFQLSQEQARTEAQLATTRVVLLTLLDEAGRKLAEMPNSEKVREELAGLVLVQYQTLEKKFPDDPGIQLEIAQVHRVVGGIARLTGQVDLASSSYRKAIELLDGLTRSYPNEPKYRFWYANALVDRGELHHLFGRLSDAEADQRAALRQASNLLPTDSHQRLRSSALLNLSEILMKRGQAGEARDCAEQAISLLTPLAAAPLDSDMGTYDRWLLAMALANAGASAAELKDQATATARFEEAARVASEVPAGDDTYPDCQFVLAQLTNHRAELQGDGQENLVRAEGEHSKAASTFRELAAESKTSPHFREELAMTLILRAHVRRKLAKLDEATRDAEEAIALIETLIKEHSEKQAPQSAQYMSLLGRAQHSSSLIHAAASRQPEAAAASADAVLNLNRCLELDPDRSQDRSLLNHILERQ